MSEHKSVHQAFAAVMDDVRSIGKNDRNTTQGFMFRGIDAVLDEVGPALRKHGVFIVPKVKTMKSESYSTSKGTMMRNVTVTMRYKVYGPAGDSFAGRVLGEAADSGDKAVTKAQSVAYRTFLLQALAVPTGDRDPDADTHERVAPKPVSPALRKALQGLGAVADKHQLDRAGLQRRFQDDYGTPILEADPKTVEAFTKVVAEEQEPAQETAEVAG